MAPLAVLVVRRAGIGEQEKDINSKREEAGEQEKASRNRRAGGGEKEQERRITKKEQHGMSRRKVA